MGILKKIMRLGQKKKNKPPVLWNSDSRFAQLYAVTKTKTLVTQDRCFMIYQYVKHALQVPGDLAEVGVYRGGTARLIAHECTPRTLFLFDTFAGMPDSAKGLDFHQRGDFNDTSLEGVKTFLQGCSNVEFRQGFFPQTAVGLEKRQFCFVHVDVDIYPSVKSCLEFFYSRMPKGAVMLFDDYEWKDCEGVKKAIDEFMKDKPEKIIVTTLYQAMLIKS